MSRRPTETEGRRAMERLAGRLSEQSERGGRKMTHDQATLIVVFYHKHHYLRSNESGVKGAAVPLLEFLQCSS